MSTVYTMTLNGNLHPNREPTFIVIPQGKTFSVVEKQCEEHGWKYCIIEVEGLAPKNLIGTKKEILEFFDKFNSNVSAKEGLKPCVG